MDTITISRERLSFLVKCLDCSIDRASNLDAMLTENIALVRDDLKDILK